MTRMIYNDTNSILYKTEKEPKKLFHTYLRNQNKLYVNFFNMIDRKSAIMIRINSTIFPIAIYFYNYIREIQYGSFIGFTLIITSFISLLFALNASRPFDGFMIFKHKKSNLLEENIFAVGMTPKSTAEKYEQAYDKLMRNQELQIGNQVRTMYKFEQYIKRSFRQLELSYVSFLVGFGIIAMSFILGRI